MYIANPIYDVVFKFMMEDEKVAKSFLSAIIEEEVLDLDFSAQEHTVYKPVKDVNKEKEEDKQLFLTVCRFDFSAKISLPGGRFKTVAVELQKAKMPSDIMRFRRYLGLHYRNPDNAFDGDDGEKKARQIYCIFLLGYDIGFPGHPVLQADSQVKDVTTKECLSASGNEFVESLHHRSWIVQIDQLKQRRRNDVEKLLSIFDQDNRTHDHHIMNVNENDFPEIYRPIIRRLRMACENEQIQIEMEMEDDYLKELQDRDRSIANRDKIIEEDKKVITEQSKEIEEKDKTIEEKDKTIEEKDKTIEEDKKVITEQSKEIEELRKQLAKFKSDNN